MFSPARRTNDRSGHMASGTTETTINASPDEVWAVIGDYYDLAAWMPGMDSCEKDGDDRILSTMGMTIRERLTKLDEARHTMTYSIVESPLSLEKHEATITVHDGTGSSRVTWDVEVVPDHMLDILVGTYGQALEALKQRIEK
jgi:carbon monoxide dehydrogenase subunit G